MSFGQKLQEQWIAAVNAGNTAMARQIRMMNKSHHLSLKQVKTINKLNFENEKLNRGHLRAYAIVSRQGHLIAGLSNRFNLLNTSMMGFALNAGKGFGKFFGDLKMGLKGLFGFGRDLMRIIPKDAKTLGFPSLPSKEAFYLRRKASLPSAQAFKGTDVPAAQRPFLATRWGLGGMGSKPFLGGSTGAQYSNPFRALSGEGIMGLFGSGIEAASTPDALSRMALTGRLRGRTKQLQGDTTASLGVTEYTPPSEKPAKQPAKLNKAFLSFNKNVAKPLMGLGMGALSTFGPIMALTIFLKVVSSIGQVFSPVMDVLTMFLELVGTGFQPIVTALLQAMTNPSTMALLMSFVGSLTDISYSLAPLMPLLVDLVVIGLVPLHFGIKLLAVVMKELAPFIQLLTNAFTYILTPVKYFIELMFGGSPGVIPAFQTAYNVAKYFVDLIFGTFKAAWDLITLAFKAVKGWYDTWIAPAFNAVLVGFKTVANGIIGIVNGIIGVINGIDVFNVVPDIARLPMLGTPSIVNPPGTLAMVGEAGKPEVVSDIDSLVGIIKEALGGSGGQQIVINIYGVAPGSNIRELALLIGRELRLIK